MMSKEGVQARIRGFTRQKQKLDLKFVACLICVAGFLSCIGCLVNNASSPSSSPPTTSTTTTTINNNNNNTSNNNRANDAPDNRVSVTDIHVNATSNNSGEVEEDQADSSCTTRHKPNRGPELVPDMQIMNLCCLLLGAVTAFGAWLVHPTAIPPPPPPSPSSSSSDEESENNEELKNLERTNDAYCSALLTMCGLGSCAFAALACCGLMKMLDAPGLTCQWPPSPASVSSFFFLLCVAALGFVMVKQADVLLVFRFSAAMEKAFAPRTKTQAC